MKIARYHLYGSDHIAEFSDYREEDRDWIRISEPLEVEFVDLDLSIVVPQKIARLDDKIKAMRDEANEKIAYVEEQKAKLMAITHDAAA